MNRLYRFFLSALIFLIPSNLFLKFYEKTAFSHGILIDYLIPKLYLTDFVLLAIFLLWGFEVFRKKWLSFKFNFSALDWTALFLIVILGIRQFFTAYPLASIWFYFKLVEFLLLTYFLRSHQSIIRNSKLIIASVVAVLLFQSTLAIYQFHSQHSLIGYLFLGEPVLTSYAGIAKSSFNGAEKILPYGTTGHPNILGGVLSIYIVILIKFLITKKQLFSRMGINILILILAGYALYLTQSISAWLSLALGLLLLFIPNSQIISRISRIIIIITIFIAPLLINLLATQYPSSPSLTRRAFLNQTAVAMFIHQPLLGVGLNNFTPEIENYGDSSEAIRFLQPVHHVGLLWLAETGLLGLLVVFIYWRQIKPTRLFYNLFVIVVPIIVLDHYLLTTQTGILTLILFVFLLSEEKPIKAQG
jgi:O-antigen ligase